LPRGTPVDIPCCMAGDGGAWSNVDCPGMVPGLPTLGGAPGKADGGIGYRPRDILAAGEHIPGFFPGRRPPSFRPLREEDRTPFGPTGADIWTVLGMAMGPYLFRDGDAARPLDLCHLEDPGFFALIDA
jgi:hypothetical protein